MDGYEALFDEIKSFLKSLDDKIDLVIKTRNILNKEQTTIPKETSTQLINNLFLVEDSLRDSCRIINKCLSFHKIQGIQTKPLSTTSTPFATSNVYQSSPSNKVVKEHKDETYNFKGLTETNVDKGSDNNNIKKKEKEKTQIKQPIPSKDIVTKHNVRKEILLHNKETNLPSEKKNNNNNNNGGSNKISKNQAKPITNNNSNNNIQSNKPKLFFAYDNSEQEISQISSNVVPSSSSSSNTHPPPEYVNININNNNNNPNIIKPPLYNNINNNNKQIQLYTEKASSNKQPIQHHTNETANTSFPSNKPKIPSQNENDYLSSDIPLHNNITINNLILSSNTDNKTEKDTSEYLNPIDTASKIKQKATKVSELVVLISANEDLFEMLSQLYDMNIIDLLLSDDIDDTTIDSVYAAIGEIERLKQNDIEEDISENENDD
jgi:hypothetical protein